VSDWQDLQSVDVLTVGMAADDVRRSVLGKVVTYLRVHHVGIPDLAEGRELAVPETASELRVHDTPRSLDDAVAMVSRVKAAAGGRRVAAFSWLDIVDREWDEPGRLRSLVQAGMQDVADLPADRITDLPAAVAALTAAGAPPQRITISHPVGARRAEIIRRVQLAFASSGALRRFAPLPRIAPADKPTTGYDDVRMVALARLAVRDRSIEVDWTLYGPKLAQVALTFGADHLDAVPAVNDSSLGPRRTTIEDVERNIRAAGFEAREYRPA
jgi:aminodeoxyfutalosine synthase